MKFKLKKNTDRKGCKDVFKSFILKDATYGGNFEFPVLEKCDEIPNSVISFSRALTTNNYNQWVHFYEDDYEFERFWNNPLKYIDILKKFKGIISPDFSVYRDMPLVMQLWNIFRSRCLAHLCHKYGIKVIPNIRFGDRRTYRVCCDGIKKGGTICLGSHGNMKNKIDKDVFLQGAGFVIDTIEPKVTIIYGTIPYEFKRKYERKTKIIVIKPEYYEQLSFRLEAI